jgi:hypothetical protein
LWFAGRSFLKKSWFWLKKSSDIGVIFCYHQVTVDTKAGGNLIFSATKRLEISTFLYRKSVLFRAFSWS